MNESYVFLCITMIINGQARMDKVNTTLIFAKYLMYLDKIHPLKRSNFSLGPRNLVESKLFSSMPAFLLF